MSIANQPEADETATLSFPGHLAADIEGRLAVSDTGHHRILLGHMVGNTFDVKEVIGRGEPGYEDGSLDRAAFRDPQGLALSGDMLIVADCGNHAVRMVDPAAGQVATMAGTGEIAHGRPAGWAGEGDPLDLPLRFPWDVLLHHHDLFIAMAGSRQIWRLVLKDRRLVPHTGPAPEEIASQPAGGPTPMALATDGHVIYFTDAGTSSVCRVPFEPGQLADTLVGTDRFDSGDADGVGDEVRLRQAAGLAWGQGNHRLWIADTCNHKLKTLEPSTRRVETVEPFDAELDEPMGLASAGHLLFIADTNHHRILRVDQIDKRVIELAVEGA